MTQRPVDTVRVVVWTLVAVVAFMAAGMMGWADTLRPVRDMVAPVVAVLGVLALVKFLRR